MNIEERIATLEADVCCLKQAKQDKDGPIRPSAELLVAAQMTARVLRQWKEDKSNILEEEDYSDYREVVQTLPVLEAAIKRCESARRA